MQPHLKKCFDNLVELEFANVVVEAPNGTQKKGIKLEAVAMISSEKERVPFSSNVTATESVEQWYLFEVYRHLNLIRLTDVEIEMRKTVGSAFHKCLKGYDSPIVSLIFQHSQNLRGKTGCLLIQLNVH